MKKYIIVVALLLFASLSKAAVFPVWFAKAFAAQKLNQKYYVLSKLKPIFFEADFNGDGKKDIALMVADRKKKKSGLLIMNNGDFKSYILGAGQKIKGEDFDDIDWAEQWELNKEKVVYETTFSAEGDIDGSRKIPIKHPAIGIFALMDGSPLAGILVYWNGRNYTSIHQGE